MTRWHTDISFQERSKVVRLKLERALINPEDLQDTQCFFASVLLASTDLINDQFRYPPERSFTLCLPKRWRNSLGDIQIYYSRNNLRCSGSNSERALLHPEDRELICTPNIFFGWHRHSPFSQNWLFI